MSLILDALRRRPRSAEAPPSPRRSSQADAVLATLGYARKRSFFSGPLDFARVMLYALAVLLAVVIGWGSYIWYQSSFPTAQPQIAGVQRPPSPAPVQTRPQPAASAPAGSPSATMSAPVTTRPAEGMQGSTTSSLPPARGGVELPVPPTTAPLPRAQRVPAPLPGPEPATRRPDAARPSPSESQPLSARESAGPSVAARPDLLPAQPTLAIRSDRVDVATAPPLTPPASPAAGVIRGPGVGVGVSTQVDHFRLALYYHRAGDFENALLQYRAVLEGNELNSEVHNNLGLLYQEKGLADEAIKQFQRAISIDQGYPKAHNNLGVVWLRAGKMDAAAAEFRAALATDPKNVESLTNLAIVNRQTGRPDEARELLQRAVTLEPRHAASQYNMALIAEERGDVRGAIQHYRAFLDNSTPDQAVLAGEVRTRVTALAAK